MKLCLLKMKSAVISFFYLLHIIKAQSDSPCPHIFNYKTEGASSLYGVITAFVPKSYQGLINVEVQISLENVTRDSQGSIELMTPDSEVEQAIQQSKPLLFKVNFPYWINIKPKIRKILINENIICVGEPISENLGRETTGTVKSLNLIFRLQTTSIPSKIRPGVQRRRRNTNNPLENNPFLRKNTVSFQTTNYNPPNFDNYNNIIKYFHPSTVQRTHIQNPPFVTDNFDNYNNIIKYFRPTTIQRTPIQQPPSVTHNFDNYNNIIRYFTTSTTQRALIQRPTSVDTSSILTSISNYCGVVTQAVKLIYEGEEFEKGSNPWLAALFKQREGKPQFICGSTIISKKHVLTSGHCVNGVSKKRFHLALGRSDIYNWFEEGAEHRSLSNILIHPDYQVNHADADLAILVMSKEVKFGITIAPVCLWSQTDHLQQTVGTTGVVAGWGTDKSGSLTAKATQITLPIVSDEICLRSGIEFNYITSNRTFCAGSRNNVGPCNGDSGGGFYVEINNKWFIRGIVSTSLSTKNRTCDLSNYVVFVDIAKHANWIMSNVT